LCNNMQYAVV